MNIVGMAYGQSHFDQLNRREADLKLKNLAVRQQDEMTALQNLQREYAMNLSPDMKRSLAAQMRLKQQRIYSFDVYAALLTTGLVGGMFASGKSKRKRPGVAAPAPLAK